MGEHIHRLYGTGISKRCHDFHFLPNISLRSAGRERSQGASIHAMASIYSGSSAMSYFDFEASLAALFMRWERKGKNIWRFSLWHSALLAWLLMGARARYY